MEIKLIHGELQAVEADAIALFVYEDDNKRAEQIQSIVKHIPAVAAVADTEDFKGKKKQRTGCLHSRCD